MTLPILGQAISLANLQTEFGGSNPIGIAEYYRGAGYVPSGATQIPATGRIELDDFYSFELAPTTPIGGTLLGYSAGNTSVGTKYNSSHTVPQYTTTATYRLNWSITASANYGYTSARFQLYKNETQIYVGTVGGGPTLGGNDTWYRDFSGTRTGSHEFSLAAGNSCRLLINVSTRDSNRYTPNHTAISGIITRLS